MRVVIDTNVLVSSFFGGAPGEVLSLWRDGRITLCLSQPSGRRDGDEETSYLVFGQLRFSGSFINTSRTHPACCYNATILVPF